MADCFTVFQPLPHSAVAIGIKTFVLLISDFLCQCGVFLGPVQILYKAVIAASGHRKESAHDKYRILFPVTVNDSIFCPGSHFLSVDCRKSRSNSFSIFNRRISRACSAIISPGSPPFLGRPFGFGKIPASSLVCLRLYRLIQFLICTLLNPNWFAISCRVAPASRKARISSSFTWICVYFCLDIRTPPV